MIFPEMFEKTQVSTTKLLVEFGRWLMFCIEITKYTQSSRDVLYFFCGGLMNFGFGWFHSHFSQREWTVEPRGSCPAH